VGAHITIRQDQPEGAAGSEQESGLAVPAMRKKIIAWSNAADAGPMRQSTCRETTVRPRREGGTAAADT